MKIIYFCLIIISIKSRLKTFHALIEKTNKKYRNAFVSSPRKKIKKIKKCLCDTFGFYIHQTDEWVTWTSIIRLRQSWTITGNIWRTSWEDFFSLPFILFFFISSFFTSLASLHPKRTVIHWLFVTLPSFPPLPITYHLIKLFLFPLLENYQPNIFKTCISRLTKYWST